MRTISLTRGKVAVVDDSDFDELSRYKWHAVPGGRTWYAVREVRLADGKRTAVGMHVAIMGKPGVDHIDGDGLNNSRSNLRLVTRFQNARNRRPDVGSSSRYVGVTWYKSTSKWCAQISWSEEGKRRTKNLGYFLSEEAAARARDKAAFERDPEHAYLNFPEEHRE